MAGMMYSEVFLLAASTSANRLGSKLARETRTTAVVGNDSAMVILSVTGILSLGTYIATYPQYINRNAIERMCHFSDTLKRTP